MYPPDTTSPAAPEENPKCLILMPPRSMASPPAPDLALGDEELRQRACLELLRQAAQRMEGLLDADDAPSTDGVISEAAANAIEALLEREIVLPLPSDDACRRHFETP